MSGPYLTLLGGGSVSTPQGQFRLPSDQRGQLLAFLACHGGWVERGKLAFLFWPDHDETASRRNLRKLLFKVRELDWTAGLVVERTAASWQVDSDLKAFEAALAQRDWLAATELYRGPLLPGLDPGGGEFSDWLAAERERLDGRWREAAMQAAAELEASLRERDAARLLRRMIEHDPFDEAAVQALMRLELRGGGVPEAIRVFRQFSSGLRAAFGLEPSADLRRMAAAAERGDSEELSELVGLRQGRGGALLAAPSPSALPGARLPFHSTPFIGREQELASLLELLRSSGTRLVTLVGVGGVGKSRLAARVAELAAQACAAPEGPESGIPTGQPGSPWGAVHSDLAATRLGFAQLDALTSADAVGAAVATALGVALAGPAAPEEQVIAAVGAERALLVLDNFEHLMPAAPMVSALLAGCPNLKVLVTSRQRLNLRAERLFPLGGLGLPPSEVDPGRAAGYDAMALFADAARRVQPDFVVDDGNHSQVRRVCSLLDGSPLGIELAAAWVRVMPPNAIAEEIEQGLDFLTGAPSDSSERHRSLRATFEHSWELLVPAERLVLSRLAVFRGGFTAQGARQVAEAPLPVLAALVDKSLLRLNVNGRYDRHPLVFGFAQEKLEQERSEVVRCKDAHLDFFVRFLDGIGDRITGPGQKEELAKVEVEHENLFNAWNWALDGHCSRDLRSLARYLMLFYDARGRPQDGVQLFQSAISTLDSGDPQERGALAYLLVEQAWLLFRLGRLEEGRSAAATGVELARAAGDGPSLAKGLFTLGNVAWRLGDYREAADRFAEALSLARKQRNLGAIASLLNSLAILEGTLGRPSRAKRFYRQAMDSNRSRGNQIGLITNLNGLASLLLADGKPAVAVPLLEEGLALARSADYRESWPNLLANYGIASFQLGRLDAAWRTCQEALELSREHGALSASARVLAVLGRIATARQDYDTARKCAVEAVETAWSINDTPAAIEGLVSLAELYLKSGRAALAADLLDAVMAHPATTSTMRGLAANLATHLGADAELGEHQPRGQAATGSASFEAVVRDALALRP